MADYIIKTTDGSFDYLSPWGISTHNCLEYHGFEFDDRDIKSFKAFGDYSYLNEIKDDINGLIEEIDLILLRDYDEEDPEVTPTEVMEEAMEFLREIALKKAVA